MTKRACICDVKTEGQDTEKKTSSGRRSIRVAVRVGRREKD